LSGTQVEYYKIIRSTGIKVQMIPGMITGGAVYILSTLIASGILNFRFFLTPMAMRFIWVSAIALCNDVTRKYWKKRLLPC